MNDWTSPVDIRPDHLEMVQDILRERLPAGFKVWVFGSRANWTTKDSSDLDLAVEGTGRLDYRVMADLEIAFEESDLPYTVDVVDLHVVNDAFKKIVESQRVPLPMAGSSGNEWREVALSDIGTIDRGRSRHRPRNAPELYGGPYPFIQTGDIKSSGGRIVSHTQTYSELGLSQSRLWPAGTMAITIAANIAETAILTYPACFPDSVVGFIGDQSKCDTRFVEYNFRQLRNKIQHENVGTGSAQDNINLQTLGDLRFPLPPLPEQRAIAHILGTLDDKIELNRRMNQTLEAMARAIFQDWFVDFGPVRAKMEGQDPYLPPELWDLFPDDLVDSELGEIPEGWDVKTLSGCIDVERGLSYKGSGLGSTGIPMHNLNSLYEGGGYKHDGIKYYNGDYRERHVTEPGDVLVANTEQGHDRLLIGFAAIVPDRSGHRGLFSHHLYRMRPKIHSGLSADFLCKLLNTEAMHDTVSGFATGTTVNMLPADALQIPGIVYPPVSVVTAYTAIAKTARRRQEHLYEESRTLAEQRDAFLPNLVSGELLLGN